MQCCLIAFTHSRTSFKIGFYPDLLLLYQLSFPSILNSLLPLQFSPGIDSISRNHFLCLSLRTAPHLLTFYCEKAAILQVISSGSTFNSSSLAVSTTSAVNFLLCSLEPLKIIHEKFFNFFQTSVYVDVLTSSNESQMFLMASRMLNSF